MRERSDYTRQTKLAGPDPAGSSGFAVSARAALNNATRAHFGSISSNGQEPTQLIEKIQEERQAVRRFVLRCPIRVQHYGEDLFRRAGEEV